MALLFGRGLSLWVCCGVMASAYAQGTSTGAVDKLDDESEVQLQQALNDVYNKYNSQIAGIKGEMDTLASTGNKQCEMEAKAAENESKQQQSQAQMQALQGMIGPGAKTLGHVVDATMKGATNEKAAKEATLKKVLSTCELTGYLECDQNGAEPLMPNPTNCPEMAAGGPGAGAAQQLCRNNFSSEATRYTTKIANLNKEIKDTSGAMDGLVSSGMELAAAGFGAMMLNNQGKEMAGYLAESAASQEKLCKSQVAAQLTALQNQIAQLEAAKARDILMANMMAKYQTRARRNNQVENVDVENIDLENIYDDMTTPTNGGTIAVEGAPNIPGPPAIQSASMKPKGGGGGGDSGSGGGGSGGGAGSPNWDFGGGPGFDGGSRLPDQPESATYSGSGSAASNAGKGTGGFGASDAKGDGKAERGLASEEGQVIGDGGLRVLLARASLIHTRHASILLKSIDFDRLAKSQGIVPRKPTSLSPAGPN